MTAPLLAIDRLSVRLPTADGPAVALRDVSLVLDRGATLGLVGESGSGKSLTALALMGLLPEGALASGSIRFDHRELTTLDDGAYGRLRGARIGMVFQEPTTALNPLHTVGRQVAEPLRLHRGLGAAAARAEALRLLERVRLGDAARRLDAYPHQLSGGQRQRAVIAIALACGPDLLIADEPTTALDAGLQREVLALIASLVAEDRMALLLIGHDLGVMAHAVERLAVMYGGTVVESGPTAAVLGRPAHPYTRGLVAARPRPGRARGSRLATIDGRVPDLAALPPGCRFAGRCPLTLAACDGPVPEVALGDGRTARCIRLDAARTLRPTEKPPSMAGDTQPPAAAQVSAEPEQRPAAPRPSAPAAPLTGFAAARSAKVAPPGPREPATSPLLDVRGLSQHYRLPRQRLFGPAPRLQALDGVGFTLDAGRTLGVVGESGSGKSTLARLVMALETPSAGEVRFDGRPLHALGAAALRRARAGFQMVFQDPNGSLDPRQRVGRIVAEPLDALAQVGGAERRERVAEMLDAVGLRAADGDKFAHEFSGGQRQRIAIARALVTRPKLIVADEPVSALDVSVQAQVLNLMQDLQDRWGVAYLFIGHDLGVVQLMCDEVIVLWQGRVVECGPPNTLFRDPRHACTRRLRDAVLA